MTWMTRILNELLEQRSLFQTSKHRSMARMVTMPDIQKARPRQSISTLRPGQLVFFQYEATTVKLWDRFPCTMILVPPTVQDPDHFLGANFHYLMPVFRLMLFTYFLALQSRETPSKTLPVDVVVRLVRMMVKRYPVSASLYHQYRVDNVLSPAIVVPQTEWIFALTLPVEQMTAPLTQVYYRSLRSARH